MYSKVSDTQNAHRLFEANKKCRGENLYPHGRYYCYSVLAGACQNHCSSVVR